MTRLQALEARWYASLRKGKPDYSVYDGEGYMEEALKCWKLYSRKYIRSLTTLKLPGIFRVVDLGCGCGWSTRALEEAFGGATVTGTNREGSDQYRYCKAHGIRVVGSIELIKGKVDLVFASEYFEHFERPIEHVTDIVTRLKPRYLVVANSFGTRATGHFLAYRHGAEVIDGKAMGRRFNARLREMFYTRRETGFWNNRPAVWEMTGEKA